MALCKRCKSPLCTVELVTVAHNKYMRTPRSELERHAAERLVTDAQDACDQRRADSAN